MKTTVKIVAKGDTYKRRQTLKDYGFLWDADKKVWWMDGLTEKAPGKFYDDDDCLIVSNALIDGITLEVADNG